MSENLKKFLSLIASNKELEAKALACNEMDEEKGKQALIELAKENGIEITLADFEKPAEPASCELDDDELDAVAGGGGCGCAGAGGGAGTDANDGKTYGCGCALYGQGGDGNAKDSNCMCFVTGFGFDVIQIY